jgi:hypothetical protein
MIILELCFSCGFVAFFLTATRDYIFGRSSFVLFQAIGVVELPLQLAYLVERRPRGGGCQVCPAQRLLQCA